MRILNIAAVFLAIASAFLLYALNYDTRVLDAQLQGRERVAEKARADIAVLKAERAHLARPERIEPLARALGLEPMSQKHAVLPGPPSLETGSTVKPD
jgi:cell division protein FtsL